MYLELVREVFEVDVEVGWLNRLKESVGCLIVDYLDWVWWWMSVFGDGIVLVGC